MALNLILQRLRDDGNATLGHLRAGNYHCFVLEDQAQKVKVKSETRIPAGSYRLFKRSYGKFYEAYKARWDFPYVLELEDVPGFTDILIHTGNTDDHTSGCLLVGETGSFAEKAILGASRVAYKRLWGLINQEISRGEEVWIEIFDEER